MSPEAAPAAPRVMVYAPTLLPFSQTFVYEQVRALATWRAVLVGRSRAPQGIDLTDLGAPVVSLDLSPRLRPWAQVTRRVPRLAATVADLRPHVVHAHFLTGGLDLVASGATGHRPLLVTAHGFDATVASTLAQARHPRDLLLRHQRRWLVRPRPRVHFLAVSHFIRNRLIAHGADPDAVHVQYTGVDTDYFHPRLLERERRSVLFVGRLVGEKGIHVLLRAAAVLAQRGLAVPIRVAGDGPERDRVARTAARHRLDVTLLGPLPRDAVRDELARTALLCVPSMTAANGWQEGFGMVFAEAQAMGVPVVSSHLGGIPEAVRHGTTGLLVPEGSPLELADALDACLSDPDRCAALGQAGRAHVASEYSLDRRTAELEQRYTAAHEGTL